jgi:hypothetical protein
MRKSLLISGALAVLAAAFVLRAAAAAPFVDVESSMIMSPGGRSVEEIYYYNGRYYPYGYNNRYYAHRIYRQGHWRYY